MDPQDNIRAIIEVARDAATRAAQVPTEKTIDGIVCSVSADGRTITPLQIAERLLSAPRRKRARVQLYEAASFIDYVKAHALAGRTHIFGKATELGGGFTAVLDYHGVENLPAIVVSPPITSSSDAAAPAEIVAGNRITAMPISVAGFGEHVCELSLETTPEWKRWIGNNNKLLSQEAFAEFIEENQLDIVAPDAGVILDMAQLLEGTKTVTFKSGKNLRNGSVQLAYVEDVVATGGSVASRREDSMSIPDKFTLQLVPFVGANGVQVEARLRYRIGDNGRVSFAYVLNQPWKVIEAAFAATRDDIETQTSLDVHLGTVAISNPS